MFLLLITLVFMDLLFQSYVCLQAVFCMRAPAYAFVAEKTVMLFCFKPWKLIICYIQALFAFGCQRLPACFQKVSFRLAKGILLQCKRHPFAV